MIDAQFSVPFNVALGLLKKRVVFPDFTEQLFQAQEMHRLMDKVTCTVDPALDALYPEAWPAPVEIIMEGGQRLAAETRFAKGDPRNPLTEDEVSPSIRALSSVRWTMKSMIVFWGSFLTWNTNPTSPN